MRLSHFGLRDGGSLVSGTTRAILVLCAFAPTPGYAPSRGGGVPEPSGTISARRGK